MKSCIPSSVRRLGLLGFFLSCFLVFYSPESFASVNTVHALIPPKLHMPSPWGVIKVLLLLTFFIHIILVNILLGSVALATIRAWQEGPDLSFTHGLKQDISFTPSVLALTVNFGVAPFLFAQVAYGSFLYPSIVFMAIWWLAIPIIIILGYYGLYIVNASQPDFYAGRKALLTIATLLILFVAFLLTTNSSLALRPEHWVKWFESPGGVMLNLGDPTFIPRYLHFIIASMAIGGLFMAIRASWNLQKARGDEHENRAKMEKGFKWFFGASIVQALSGLWFLLALPPHVRSVFLGGKTFATLALIFGVLSFIVALFYARKRRVVLCTGYTLSLVFIMVCMRDMVRDAFLAPFNSPESFSSVGKARAGLESLNLSPEGILGFTRQWERLPHPIADGQLTALVIFLIFTLGGIITLIWLLRVTLKAFNAERNEDIIHTPSNEAGEI